MNILFIGDIVSKVGRQMVEKYLPIIKQKYPIDVVIANGENVAHGKGINQATYNKLTALGIDIITMGNHFAAKVETNTFYKNATKMVRPLNIHPSACGVGSRVFDINGQKLRVTNLLGRVFINELNPSNPFDAFDKLLETSNETFHFVDFHAEATAEKIAFAWNYDGKISCVVGTHTHVQTADERVLPNGTGFLCDVGMTGATDGIIGARKEPMIYRVRTGLPAKYEVAEGNGMLNACYITLDESGKTTSIKRIYLSSFKEEL